MTFFAVAFGSPPRAASSSLSPSTWTVVLAIGVLHRRDLDEAPAAFVGFLDAVDRPVLALVNDAINRRDGPRLGRRADRKPRPKRRADLPGRELLPVAHVPAHGPNRDEIRPRLDRLVELVRSAGEALDGNAAV